MKQNCKNFCGARLEKIKNNGVMSVKEKHNFRDKNFEFGDNVNKDLSENNKIWKFGDYKDSLINTYNDCLKKCKRKPRRDHIKAFEYLFYRSDCFDLDCEYEQYRECTINFIKDYFKDCPVLVVEHNDEAVQHFHVFVIPCKEKNGEYKFCGSDFCEKKKMLTDLQTFYANSCSSCNLKRGREKSFDRHIKIQEFYEQENQKLINQFDQIIKDNDETLKLNQQLLEENNKKNFLLEQMNNDLDSEINKYRNESYIEKIENMKKSINEYKDKLESELENDDGSYFYNIIRQCLNIFREILINNDVIKINKNNNEQTR